MVFFRVRHTVGLEISVIICLCLSSEVNSRIVHSARPDGGSEQHRAMIWAAAAPSTFAGVGGVFLDFRSNAGFSPF